MMSKTKTIARARALFPPILIIGICFYAPVLSFDIQDLPLSPRQVQTKYGTLRGVIIHLQSPSSSSATSSLPPVEAFFGVPYAAPPTKNLRFMPPVTPSYWRQIKQASRLPPLCIQRVPDIHNTSEALKTMTASRLDYIKRLQPFIKNQSEDCLYLNIYVPHNPTSGDPRTNDWPLYSGGLWRILSIMSVYLVLTRILLPKFMERRAPYQMKKTILVYNLSMVVTNFYFFCFVVYSIDYGRIFLDFKFPSRNDRSQITLYFMSMDTVFFVLRKKESQVTMLHMYHHTMVPILGWIAVKLNSMIPGMRLFLLMNTLIHTIMYGYYALSAMGPTVQKYLWWKKYITILQLAQFVVMGIYAVFGICLQTGYPTEWFLPFAVQAPLFFLMFLNFYRQSYKNRKLKTK